MNNFTKLVSAIQQLHQQLQQSAVNAVNQMLTIRNWLIGYYIVEFEQNGKDRAKYGKSLLKSIAGKLSDIKGMDERSLRRYRQFYLFYPQIASTIRATVPPKLDDVKKWGTLPPDFGQSEIVLAFNQLLTDAPKIGESLLKLPDGPFELKYQHQTFSIFLRCS